MKILRVQQEAFRKALFEEFGRRVAVHLRRFFPTACRALGEEGLSELIQDGVAQATCHGLHRERDVTLYLNLMMLLGRGFERDPAFVWARSILTDPTLPEPERRIRRLYRTAIEWMKTHRGDEYGR